MTIPITGQHWLIAGNVLDISNRSATQKYCVLKLASQTVVHHERINPRHNRHAHHLMVAYATHHKRTIYICV